VNASVTMRTMREMQIMTFLRYSSFDAENLLRCVASAIPNAQKTTASGAEAACNQCLCTTLESTLQS
jgi:hypothetical protein